MTAAPASVSETTPLPIVVGIDGRPDSDAALRYAAAEAARQGAPLRLVHVVPLVLGLGMAVPPPEMYDTGRDILRKAYDTVVELGLGIAVSAQLHRGDRRHALVRAGDEARMLVLGRESRRGLDRLLSGTVTAGVAAQASCDVVVVPPDWTDGAPKGQVVAGLKTMDNAKSLLAAAFAEAAVRQARLVVVTAWQLADPYLDRLEEFAGTDDWAAEGRAAVEQLTAGLRERYSDVEVETRVEHGSSTSVLLEASKASDLLVISRRRMPLPPYGRLGPVGHDLVRLAEVPVQLVPYTSDKGTHSESTAEPEDVVA